MRKLFKAIPDIFDIQYTPRLQGEPFMFTMKGSSRSFNSVTVRFGSYLIFLENRT